MSRSVLSGFSTLSWLGFSGTNLVQKVSVTALMRLLRDGAIAEEHGGLTNLHGEIQDNNLAVHSINHSGLGRVLTLRQASKCLDDRLIDPCLARVQQRQSRGNNFPLGLNGDGWPSLSGVGAGLVKSGHVRISNNISDQSVGLFLDGLMVEMGENVVQTRRVLFF